jgi:hypothetical protein
MDDQVDDVVALDSQSTDGVVDRQREIQDGAASGRDRITRSCQRLR